LHFSEEVGDAVSSVLANWGLGYTFFCNCEFEMASKYFSKALGMNLDARSSWGIVSMKSNLAVFCNYFSGNIDAGFDRSAEAVRDAEESGDVISKALAYAGHGYSCYGKGNLEEAEKQLLKGIDFCARANIPSYEVGSRVCLGETYFDMGDFTRSQGQFEKAASICETIQFFPSWGCLSRAGVERSKAMIDNKDVNWEALAVLIQKNRMKTFEGMHQRYLGEIFLKIDDRHFSDAERCIRMAIEADQRNGMMLHLGRDHALYAELFQRKGDRSKFQEHLGKAIDLFRECGADGWLKKAEEELATLS